MFCIIPFYNNNVHIRFLYFGYFDSGFLDIFISNHCQCYYISRNSQLWTCTTAITRSNISFSNLRHQTINCNFPSTSCYTCFSITTITNKIFICYSKIDIPLCVTITYFYYGLPMFIIYYLFKNYI